MSAAGILRTAAEVIEQRGQLRDKPDGERSMARAVAAFNALTGLQLSELQGWQFMSVLKLARSTAGAAHLDDYTDLAGYAALAAECVERETKNDDLQWNITIVDGSDASGPYTEHRYENGFVHRRYVVGAGKAAG